MASFSYAANIVTFYAAYGEYHSNRWNILVHMVFIPTIVYSLMGLMRNISLGIMHPQDPLYIHSGVVLMAFCWVLYIYEDVASGIAAFLISLVLYFGANYTAIYMGESANSFFALV